MVQKVGRNDPCPCGSGKKYKNCHLPLEQEQKKTYTAAGRRKFTAKVISTTDKSQSIFARASSVEAGPALSPEELKFKMTDHDFRIKPSEESAPSFMQTESETPISQEPITQIPKGEFEQTKEDYRKKKEKQEG